MEESKIISLVPEGSVHRVVGKRIVLLPSVTLELLATRLIELETWELKELNDPFWRLYLPVSGRATIWIDGGAVHDECELVPGHAYLIPPRTTFSSTNPEPFSKWYVHFSLGPGADRAAFGVYPVALTPHMKSIVKGFPEMVEAPFPWMTSALVAEALQQMPTEAWARQRLDARVQLAVDYMHSNLWRKLTASDVARAAGLSVRNLNHLFNRYFKNAPMRVLLDFRLDRACRLLRHSDFSIEQIAEDCGFPNRYYFSRMLKQHRGTSPAAYRRSEV